MVGYPKKLALPYPITPWMPLLKKPADFWQKVKVSDRLGGEKQ
ncbi:hypothetical protein B4100_0848 [Heyndrickxia coagulans]|nr:hypothetical protein B4100_0848 [Heyndrickxia coagulans]